MNLKSLIKQKDDILFSADEDLIKAIQKLEKGLREKLLSILAKMDKSGGSFVTDSEYNQELIQSLSKEIKKYMSSAQFTAPTEKYMNLFRDLDEVNNQIFTATTKRFKAATARKLIGPLRAGLVDTIADNLTNPASITNAISPIIKRTLFRQILLGTTFKQAEDEFLRLLPGTGNAGLLQRYTTQIVRDSINQYDGAVQQKVSEEIGLNAFMFVGSIIETSRPGCIHMVYAPDGVEICRGSGKNRSCRLEANRFADIVLPGGGFLVKDIPTIIQKNKNDSGWNPDTTADNYLVYRNGFNCRHQTVPFFATDAERISKEIKQ